MKRILTSLLIIGATIGTISVAGTGAFFSDTETSSGNILTAGSLNLQVGSTDPTTFNFTATDIKPGDIGEVEVPVSNIGSINGFLNITFSNLVDEDLGCNEPESSAPDATCGNPGTGEGELPESINFLVYLDENGNNAYDVGIDTLVYQGLGQGLLQGDLFNYPFPTTTTKDFRFEWNLPSGTGNIAQSDKIGFDITFELSQTLVQIAGNWHLNENSGLAAGPSAGVSSQGSFAGNPSWVPGKWNPALSFDGVDDYVSFADESALDVTGDLTLEAWIKTSQSGTQIITRKTYAYEIFVYNGHLGALLGTGTTWSGGDIVEGTANIADGAWHHVAMTYSDVSNELKLYVDGALDASSAYAVSLGSNAFDLFLGAWNDGTGSGFYLNGSIDEVKVYNRVLSGAEIATRDAIGF